MQANRPKIEYVLFDMDGKKSMPLRFGVRCWTKTANRAYDRLGGNVHHSHQ